MFNFTFNLFIKLIEIELQDADFYIFINILFYNRIYY